MSGEEAGFSKMFADKLAHAVAKLVERRVIDARSEAADALLDYLEIGGLDGPKSVPEWINQYEAKRASNKVGG